MTTTGSSLPGWLPASVAAAARAGPESDAALRDGSAWGTFLDALGRAGEVVAAADHLSAPAGYRHLMGLLALGVDEALRWSDPYEPHLRPGNVDATLKWGMDCPDALYLGTRVRADASYRLSGTRGTVRYVGLQTMAGAATRANVVVDDLTMGPDGSFEVFLSADERAGNWMPLAPDVGALVVRQFFYDWEREDPARLQVELIEGPAPKARPASSDETVARQLVALGRFVEESLAFWREMHQTLRTGALNRFQAPVARTDIGGAEENVTVWGAWALDDDQALLIEVSPPDALYWSIALGDPWWESIDYANHQSSLNGHQAVIDPDGVFRAVVANRDPEVANWLDTAGHREGPMICRWLRASGAPVPVTRTIPFDAIDDALPPDTARVDAEQRARTIAARRAGVRRRFCR